MVSISHKEYIKEILEILEILELLEIFCYAGYFS